MNNKNFIQALSKQVGLSHAETQKWVFTMIDAMNDSFQNGDNVSISNFGTFEVKKRLERIVVNPVTHQRMLVPPKLVLGFKPFASIRKVLKEGGRDND